MLIGIHYYMEIERDPVGLKNYYISFSFPFLLLLPSLIHFLRFYRLVTIF